MRKSMAVAVLAGTLIATSIGGAHAASSRGNGFTQSAAIYRSKW